MIVAGHRRPEEDNALDVRSCGLTGAFHKFVDGICRNHCILTSRKSKLPTAACTTPARAPPAKAAETASATESTAPTPKASASAPPPGNVRKKDPEKDATQRRGENDQEDDDQENDPAKRKA